MGILDENIGSAKDNMKSPVHNWYRFTAGFSYKFVDVILEKFTNKDIMVFEPFAGCGTTLVECQKLGFRCVGNESQELMCNIINAKLNWNVPEKIILEGLGLIDDYLKKNMYSDDLEKEYNPLLLSLYDDNSLRELYCIRDAVRTLDDNQLQLFFNLALSQTLHKAALYPIAVPYISRSKQIVDFGHAWEKFKMITESMMLDLKKLSRKERLAQVYNFDSRQDNPNIASSSCGLCITSPPYLNNLDYGEVSKVHSHFFELTSNWNDITEKVRRKLVTGATTHYRDTEFDMETFMENEFAQNNKELIKELLSLFEGIKKNAKIRKGKKSFHILMMYYFEDMYFVLKEMRRVLSDGAEAFLILGDSAPYGILIPTTQLLGEIALSTGFREYEIHKIRDRGDKWKGLTNRHDVLLSEKVLILR